MRVLWQDGAIVECEVYECVTPRSPGWPVHYILRGGHRVWVVPGVLFDFVEV